MIKYTITSLVFTFVAITNSFSVHGQTASAAIGTQTWTTENFNASTFSNGDAIPEAKTVEEWAKAASEKKPAWCYFEFNAANAKYGKLYNWYAVIDPRKLAPTGWHVPSEKEWQALSDFYGGDMAASNKVSEGTPFDGKIYGSMSMGKYFNDMTVSWWSTTTVANEYATGVKTMILLSRMFMTTNSEYTSGAYIRLVKD